MPLEHLLHAVDHALGPELRRASRGAGDPQRLLPAPAPGRERQQVGQVVVVIDVQVGDEDVVDLLHRDAHREDVLHAARAEVEEEPVAVPELNHDAGAGLITPRWERATTDERDPHLVRPEGLTGGEVVVAGADRRRRRVVRRELRATARVPPVRVLGERRAVCIEVGSAVSIDVLLCPALTGRRWFRPASRMAPCWEGCGGMITRVIRRTAAHGAGPRGASWRATRSLLGRSGAP